MISQINQNNNLTNLTTLSAKQTDAVKLPLMQNVGIGRDISISDFLARPVCLYTYTGSGTLAFTEIDFVNDFLNIVEVQRKIQFQHLLRGTFRLTFVLTVNPYACGQIICSRYMVPFLGSNLTTTDQQALTCCLSTKHHVILDCSSNNVGELLIPITPDNPYINVSSGTDTSQEVFYLGVTNLTPLISTLDGTNSSYTLRIYSSIIDSELTVPVANDQAAIYTSEINATLSEFKLPQTIVSSTENVVSAAIHDYTYASELCETGMGALSIASGFSRPKNIETFSYPHEESYTDYAGPLRVKTLTLDPMAEIPVISTNLGEKSEDVLSYKNIMGREGICSFFNWTTAVSTSTAVLNIPVAPSLCYVNTTTNIASPTPLAYGSQLFNLWRGSIKYRVVVTSNRFVRGKLRFFWNPTVMTGSIVSAKYQQISQNAPSVILDLATSSEITISVPWGHERQYLPVQGFKNATGSNWLPNGYLIAAVEEPLVLPSTASVSLDLIVWSSMGDDMVFYLPDIRKLQYYKRQLYNTGMSSATLVTTLSGNNMFNINPPGIPGGVDDSWTAVYAEETADIQPYPNLPVLSSSHELFVSSTNEMVDKLQMGEKFDSFRPLLKRFYPFWLTGTTASKPIEQLYVPYLPTEPLYVNPGGGYVFPSAMMTPTRWVSNMFFGVKGAMRYRLNFVGTLPPKVNIYRNFGQPFSGESYDAINWMWTKANAGTGETSYIVGSEPIYYEIPFQNVSQYFPTYPDATLNYTLYGSALEFIDLNSTCAFEVYNSIGEDFNPVIWNGIPQVSLIINIEP